MIFTWKDYSKEHVDTVERFLDEEAVKNTGIEDGFKDFYDYWKKESSVCRYGFWCKLVCENDIPIAVIAFGDGEEGNTVISAIIVTPELRGKGLGNRILREFITEPQKILGKNQNKYTAVIFTNNIASQKAFKKAGFTQISTHPDGDCFNYEYVIKEIKNMPSTLNLNIMFR